MEHFHSWAQTSFPSYYWWLNDDETYLHCNSILSSGKIVQWSISPMGNGHDLDNFISGTKELQEYLKKCICSPHTFGYKLYVGQLMYEDSSEYSNIGTLVIKPIAEVAS